MEYDGTEIARRLNLVAPFPQHGIVRWGDDRAALVFPFLRATWELAEHNATLTRKRRIKIRDEIVAFNFQHRWFRVLYVMNRIARLTSAIEREEDVLNRFGELNELPYWLDIFFVYARVLADSIGACLGRILSDKPGSFPLDAKKLVREESWITHAALRCSPDELRLALTKGAAWLDLISPNTRKGIRDSIVHRFSQWQVYVSQNKGASRIAQAQLFGVDTDIAKDEGLSTIAGIASGMCAFLSALPMETWIRREFDGRDIIVSVDGSGLAARFIPEISYSI